MLTWERWIKTRQFDDNIFLKFYPGWPARQHVHWCPWYCWAEANLWPMDAAAGWIVIQTLYFYLFFICFCICICICICISCRVASLVRSCWQQRSDLLAAKLLWRHQSLWSRWELTPLQHLKVKPIPTCLQVIPVHGQPDQSSSSSDSDSSDDEGQDIKILNNRMIGCMDKVFWIAVLYVETCWWYRFGQVRLLQQAKQAFAGGLPEMEDRSEDIAALKNRWRHDCEECSTSWLVGLVVGGTSWLGGPVDMNWHSFLYHWRRTKLTV